DKLAAEQGRLEEIIQAHDGHNLNVQLERAADALRLPDWDAKIANLSGGERRRVALCRLLLEKPDMLLLDEPTNDLDIETLRALENALLEFPGCAMVISHDRWFLDRIATHILDYQDEGKVEFFEGNFTEYEEYKKRTLGADALEPKRIKYKRIAK
ncbi:ATP-binding cassette domain-containing protein, partial [Bacteroides thetaiotaomicron]